MGTQENGERPGVLLAATRDPELRRQLEEITCPRISTVEFVPSGRAMLRKVAPDGLLPHEADGGLIRIVLLDDELADVRGRDLLPRLRQARGDLKVIFVTRRPDETLEIRVRQEGVYFFMVKPLDGNILARVIEKAVEHESTSRRISAAGVSKIAV